MYKRQGESITVFGTADPNSWVALKAVDEEGSILFFDTVKADGDGNYSLDLIIPEMAAGSLEIIAGAGANVASQTLLVGRLSTQVSLELSSYEAVVGESITAVSYTHLISFHPLWICLMLGMGFPFPPMPQKQSKAPVSYTHLDVYKRQTGIRV